MLVIPCVLASSRLNNMKKSLLIPALFLIILSSACSDHTCAPNIGMRIALVSFTPEQADTIVLRRFLKGSNFATAHDTLLIDSSLMKYRNRNDTLFPAV